MEGGASGAFGGGDAMAMGEGGRPTCGTCPYWDRAGDGPYGWCHRYPPQLAPNPDREDRRVEELRPVMSSSRWCGEHPDFPAYLGSRRAPSVPESGG